MVCLDVRAYRARAGISRRANDATDDMRGWVCLDVSRSSGGWGISRQAEGAPDDMRGRPRCV